MLNEYQKRVSLASEDEILGYGGVQKISRETGVSRVTISSGLKELNAMEGQTEDDLQQIIHQQRIRKEGAGRKPIEETQPGIKEALESLTK